MKAVKLELLGFPRGGKGRPVTRNASRTRTHPHAGFYAVTYVLEDSEGNLRVATLSATIL